MYNGAIRVSLRLLSSPYICTQSTAVYHISLECMNERQCGSVHSQKHIHVRRRTRLLLFYSFSCNEYILNFQLLRCQPLGENF